MSVTTATSILQAAQPPSERWHRVKLRAGYFLAASLVIALGLYGFDYYLLDSTQRPFSPKYMILKPNGQLGLWLGIFGALIFLAIFLYPIRKRSAWLRSRGNTRHWLDFHVLMGLTAPFIIAFHASFKFGGLAGVAFWIMTTVAISGVVGRYLYAQIPRSLNTAELSLQEARDEQVRLTEQLGNQKLFSPSLLAPLFRLPSEQKVRSEPVVFALASMMFLDFLRFIHIASLRVRVLGFWGRLGTLGEILPSGNREVERVFAMARRQAGLSKRILFLSRTH